MTKRRPATVFLPRHVIASLLSRTIYSRVPCDKATAGRRTPKRPRVWYKDRTSPQTKSSTGKLIVLKPDLELKVGRRQTDGMVRLASLGHDLLQMSVSYKGERASSVVLTRSQIATLRQALAEYELSLNPPEREAEVWDRIERRSR